MRRLGWCWWWAWRGLFGVTGRIESAGSRQLSAVSKWQGSDRGGSMVDKKNVSLAMRISNGRTSEEVVRLVSSGVLLYDAAAYWFSSFRADCPTEFTTSRCGGSIAVLAHTLPCFRDLRLS